MSETWAISGLDLHLEVPGTRVRAGLEEALRTAVSSGRLVPGTRLPSSRTLARDLRLARNTVADAYTQLVAEGWLVACLGSGTWVAGAPAPPPATVPRADQAAPARYDLRAGSPDLSSFPRAGWLAAARRALVAAPDAAFGYGDPRGRPELRTALAGYLARTRGVRAEPGRIVVCSGFGQALPLLAEVLRDRGVTAMAAESHTLPSAAQAIARAGLRRVVLPVDQAGAVLDGLGGAGALLLTPAHQFPLGVALAPGRRTRAVAWAAETGGLIIEDDYDGEFRYGRQPVGALQARSPERVVYAGTASKTLAPGLRLGWLVLPAHLVDDVTEAKRAADRQAGVAEQLTLAEFIRSGGYDRHVRRRRLAYRRRRDRLAAALAAQCPRCTVSGIAAGLHAVVDVPGGPSEADLVAGARRRGLALEGLSTYGPSDAGRCALVIGYGSPPDHAFTGALARLCALLAAAPG
jgi:GntR family transcriptional regulator / MocR family aminotransferase